MKKNLYKKIVHLLAVIKVKSMGRQSAKEKPTHNKKNDIENNKGNNKDNNKDKENIEKNNNFQGQNSIEKTAEHIQEPEKTTEERLDELLGNIMQTSKKEEKTINQKIVEIKLQEDIKAKLSEEKKPSYQPPRNMVDDSRDTEIRELRQEINRLRRGRHRKKIIASVVRSVVVFVAIISIISNIWVPILRVTGNTMEPTIKEGQFVYVSKIAEISKSDIVAFYYNNKILVKRVIAMPGDWVYITPDGTVYVNDVALEEPYILQKSIGNCNIEFPYQVPVSRLFVMGDNREISLDSRNNEIGCISEEQLIGKIAFKVWPLNEIGIIE